MRIHGIKAAIKNLSNETVYGWMMRRRAIAIVACLALSLIFVAAIPRLTFQTTVYDMVIEDLEESWDYRDFKARFGSEEIIRVVVAGADVFDRPTFLKIAAMARLLGEIDGVRRTISLPDVKSTVDLSGNWPMEQFRDRVADVPLLRRHLISDDHRTTLITLLLEDGADHPQVLERVREVIRQSSPQLTLYQMGMPVISEALADFTESDFLRLPPVTFVLVTLLLLALLRNLQDVLISMACVLMALIWTLGLIAVSGTALSILTLIVPVFLIAVGTAYSLHIISEYRYQAGRCTSAESAILATFDATAFPTLLAVATTVLGLGTLLVSRIAAINTFALFACAGMLSMAVILNTFLPAVLSLRHVSPTADVRRPPCPAGIQRIIDGIVALNLKHPKATLSVVGAVALVCAGGIPRLKVETNPVGFFRKDTAVRQQFDDIHQRLSGSLPVNIRVTGPTADYFQDTAAIAALDRCQRFAESLPGVDKAVSYAEYLKLVNYATNGYAREHYRLPTESFEVRLLTNSYRMLLGQDMLDTFITPDFSQANIVLFTHISSSRELLRLRDRILAHVQNGYAPDMTWNVTGFGVVISASSHHLVNGQLKSLSLTLMAVFGVMLALFLSWKVALIAIMPNIFPIVVNFGIMGWLGVELSMATSLIASIAIGLAVDDTIHYLVRFNREFKTDLDSRRALVATLHHIGRPILFTTITIGIGFAVLMLSGFKPTAVFGAMMTLTLVAALVGDLILLPSLMQYVELVTLWDLVRIRMGKDPSREIPLFQGLSRTEMHSILMAGTIRQIPAGGVLFRKGESSDGMYAVLSGRFEVIDHEPQAPGCELCGIQTHIRYATKGEILGEMGMLRAKPRSATVVAVDAGELLPVNWKVIQRLQWLYPPTALKFFNNLLTILCNRLETLTHGIAIESQTDDLTHLCNRKGLCGILEREASRAGRSGHPLTLCIIDVCFDDPQPQREIGVLQRLSTALRTLVRGSDTVSRIDANRFALLITESADDAINTLYLRIRAEVNRIRSELKSAAFSIVFARTTIPAGSHGAGSQILADALNRMDTRRDGRVNPNKEIRTDQHA